MTTLANENDIFTPIVGRVLRIEDVTWGQGRDRFVVRYRGQLVAESSRAYEQVASALRPHEITPLFRREKGQDAIVLMRGVVKPKPSNPWINLLLFLLTLVSMLMAGVIYSYEGPEPADLLSYLQVLLTNLDQGVAFGVSMLAILLAHEFGHYLAARYHKTAVSLPYFLPLPLSPFGTLGAFIQLKEPPRNRRVLLDIGLAGPLAGLVVAIPVLLIGLSLSSVERLPFALAPGQGISLEGNSILYLLSKYLVHGQLLPAPLTYHGLSPLMYWVYYFFTGTPIPYGAYDVILHPMAWAGWAGLLVTALNLIPAGQFDGGHLIYVLLGKRARLLLPFIIGGLALLGFAWSGWWLWMVLVLLMGRVNAEPLDQITALDPRRKALALLGLIVFILVFTPVPLKVLVGG